MFLARMKNIYSLIQINTQAGSLGRKMKFEKNIRQADAYI